jgi:hypothetical protein
LSSFLTLEELACDLLDEDDPSRGVAFFAERVGGCGVFERERSRERYSEHASGRQSDRDLEDVAGERVGVRHFRRRSAGPTGADLPVGPLQRGPDLFVGVHCQGGFADHNEVESLDSLPVACRRAIAHVAALTRGQSMDPSLRVTLNFHPDRLAGATTLTLEAMAREGIYRSQFETGTSNGSLTARPGGDRWLWESRIFGNAYDKVPAQQRPKYGALNFRRQRVGGSPRFGSAHLRPREQILHRTTFCYPDSVCEPTHFGIASRMSLIGIAEADERDQLDDYIEAQVHGPVLLDADVEALVLDPCFRNTDVEQSATKLPCPVEWHGGFRLGVEELQLRPGYRGLRYVELGSLLAQDGHIDPKIIGDAARTGRYEEHALKRVWHYLARYGGPSLTNPG